MNRYTKLTFSFFLLIIPIWGWTQTKNSVTLEECYKLAVESSTIGERDRLSAEVAKSQSKELKATYIPSASLNGFASYQSDVVHIPVAMVEQPRKELYRATIDIEQFIYDGGASSKGREIVASNLKAELLKIDIEKLSLKDEVANLFLTIELLKKNEGIILLQIGIINSSLKKLNNLATNGVATRGDIIKLETELLQQKQHLIETCLNRVRIIEMLSILTQAKLSIDTEFILPNYDVQMTASSMRPELMLFDAQTETLEWQKELTSRKNMPKVSAFATGGNGLPGLNMLSRNSEWYYVVGVKLSIPLTNWKTTKHTRQTYTSQQSIIKARKRDFERNNNVAISSNMREIEKFRELILFEKQIIAKKEESLQIEQQKLENGIITTNEYITELNGYKAALLSQNLNEIKLTEAIINYKSNIGDN